MKVRLTATLVASASLLGACSDTINGRAIAEPEVVRFHERLKARDFDGMYDAASEDFKSVAPRETTVALFAAIDRKLGKLVETTPVNWNVNTYNLTTTVVLVYQSKFQDGTAAETFTIRVKDGAAELIGYEISSLDMLIR